MSAPDEHADSSFAARRAEVEALIPHRDPFLFVDEILERDLADERPSVRVRWTVRADSDFYRGHYPGRPVTPGVLLGEHAFQAGAILVSLRLGGFSEDDGVPVLTRIESAKFKRMVAPGDTVETEAVAVERLGPAWYMEAVVRVGGKVAVRLRFVLSATAAMARIGASGQRPGAGA